MSPKKMIGLLCACGRKGYEVLRQAERGGSIRPYVPRTDMGSARKGFRFEPMTVFQTTSE